MWYERCSIHFVGRPADHLRSCWRSERDRNIESLVSLPYSQQTTSSTAFTPFGFAAIVVFLSQVWFTVNHNEQTQQVCPGLAAGIVAPVVLAAYNQQVAEGVWRVSFGIGIVLPVILFFFFRVRMINSTQYRKHAVKTKTPYLLATKRYWKPMLGTCLAWFFYDFLTYPFGLFSSTIIAQLNLNHTLVQDIDLGTVVNCFYLPGCIAGGLLMDRIGRKQTMALGFSCWAITGFIIGGALSPIQYILPLFVVLYGTFQAFGEMGPGVATFLCRAESFQTPLRGHFLGLAAAVGKAVSAIGTQVFMPIQSSFTDEFRGTRYFSHWRGVCDGRWCPFLVPYFG